MQAGPHRVSQKTKGSGEKRWAGAFTGVLRKGWARLSKLASLNSFSGPWGIETGPSL